MKRKKVFCSILISYIVIILTPVFILGSVLFNSFSTFFKNELITGQVNLLNRIQSTFDIFISEMSANSHLMFNSSAFTTSYIKTEYGNMYDITSKLATVSYTNSFIDNVFYVNDEIKLVYTPETVYNYQNFRAFVGDYSNLDHDTPVMLLQNMYRYWLPEQDISSDGKKVLTYVTTDKRGRLAPRSSITYQINTETISRLFGKIDEKAGICLIIVDENNKILYSSDHSFSDKVFNVWSEFADKDGSNPDNIEINGEEIFSYYIDSAVSSLKYVTLIPYQSIIAPIEMYKMRTYFFIALIVLLGSCFISYFMKLNYAPIRKIGKLAHSIFGESHEMMDEFEATEKALNNMTELQHIQRKNMITLKLINGGYNSLEEIQSDKVLESLELPGPFFRIIVCCISHYGKYHIDSGFYSEVAGFIKETLNTYIECIVIHLPNNGSICIIFSGKKAELENLDDKYVYLKNLLEYTYNLKFSIGIGKICSVIDMSVSFLQADTASKYQLVKGISSINYYESIISESTLQFKYPDYLIEVFYNAIKHGDKQKIQEAITSLTEYVSQPRNIFFATCFSFDIINTALKAMREMNYSFSSFCGKYPEIVNMSCLNSKQDIEKIVRILTDELLQTIPIKEDSSEAWQSEIILSAFDQIMQYILSHYNESSFSAKSLSASFGMSVSNMSHYFKKHTGQTVSEYISLLRFERAKEILRTTDVNLNEISQMCGYWNLSTFVRQFKSRAGTTPSNYRNEFRK